MGLEKRTRPFMTAGCRRGWCVGWLVVGALLAGNQSAQASPPIRGNELVSVENRNFGDVRRVTGASDSGDQVLYITTASADHANGSFLLSATVASRSATGWTLAPGDPIAPQLTGGNTRIVQTLAVNKDFSKLLIRAQADLVPQDLDGGDPDLYLVDVGSGRATLLTGEPGTVNTAVGAAFQFAGASRDLSRVYFVALNVSLLPGAPAGALYDWNDGQLELVTANGVPASGPAALAYSRSGFDTSLTVPAARLAHGGPHVVSDDGSTVFFGLSGTLYARRDGTAIPVSATQRAGGPPATYAVFVGASRDGDIVYFISNDQLTDAATPGGGLYRHVLSTGALTLVTPDSGGGLNAFDSNISDDASHVYFVAVAALTPEAQAGMANVYVYSNGVTRLVASTPAGATVQRVSRDGRFAVIQTTGSLAGAPNNGKVALYEYDDLTGDVSCVSCRADGSPSQGDATLYDNAPPGLASFVELSAARNITDDGHVFFASADKLVADDVTTASDVYEYSEGSLALLSTGRSMYDSYVADNSDDGRDAFFVTRSPLVPGGDASGYANLYDARIGGGFPYSPPVNNAPCAADCQQPAPSPVLPSSGTSTLRDPGNLDEKPLPDEKPATLSVTPVKTVSGMTRGLRVKVSGGGSIRLSGTSVRSSTRSITKAGTYALNARLTVRARSTLKRRHTMKATVSVVFTARGGTSATKRVTLTFREPKPSRARHGRTSAKAGG